MDSPQRLELTIADAMRLGGSLFTAWKFVDAESVFRQVLIADPLNHHAASAIAVCLIEQKKCAEALPFLDQAGTLLRDELVTVASNRGRALADLGRSTEALAAFESILRNSPEHLTSLYNRGLVLLQMGRHREAIRDLDHVLAREPDNDKARFGRGFANLVLGNYEEGFRDYECRLKDVIDEPKAPLWTGSEDLQGKTILVHGEQGLGDNIMFARYLPMLVERGAKVKVWVPPCVRTLLADLNGVEVLQEDDPATWGAFDYWVRFMSLAWCFRTTAQTVPPPVPLSSTIRRIGPWVQRIRTGDNRLKIGLCWSGSRESRYDEYRSIPLARLAPLFELNATFYSLQKDVRAEDAEAFARLPIIDIESDLHCFADTADVMACLDLVVTVDTSVAHLAGSVGVPTFVMLTAFRTYWLWIEQRKNSPWYPSVQVVRQDRDGDWDGVVAQIRAALQEKVSAQAA